MCNIIITMTVHRSVTHHRVLNVQYFFCQKKVLSIFLLSVSTRILLYSASTKFVWEVSDGLMRTVAAFTQQYEITEH